MTTTQELVELLHEAIESGMSVCYDDTFAAAASRLSEMDAENKRLRAFAQRVSEIPSPRKRPEDDIDALYQNEEHFAAVIDAARAALEQQQKETP